MIWKQPKCPSTDEWIEDVVHIYNGILLNLKIMPFAATWMNLEVIILREVRKIDKHLTTSLTCGV